MSTFYFFNVNLMLRKLKLIFNKDTNKSGIFQIIYTIKQIISTNIY